jgi:hypothetical protein
LLKTAILTLLLVTAASWSWKIAMVSVNPPAWFGSALKFGWLIPLRGGADHCIRA